MFAKLNLSKYCSFNSVVAHTQSSVGNNTELILLWKEPLPVFGLVTSYEKLLHEFESFIGWIATTLDVTKIYFAIIAVVPNRTRQPADSDLDCCKPSCKFLRFRFESL